MTLTIVSDPGDEIHHITQELDVEKRALRMSEAAEVEGRVANHAVWLQTLERRRARVDDLERKRDELLARDEAEAELAEEWRPDEAA